MFRYQNLPAVLSRNDQLVSEAQAIFAGANIIQLRGSKYSGADKTENDPRIFFEYVRKYGKRLGRESEYNEYNFKIELPTASVRPFLKRVKIVLQHIKITLRAPMESQIRLEDLVERELLSTEKPWNMAEVDWLYPVRELKMLGFGELEELEIEVKYYPDPDHRGEGVLEMKKWTESAVSTTEIAKECRSLTLRFVYEP